MTASYLQMSIPFMVSLGLLAGCASNTDLVREAATGHTATVQTLLAKGVDANAVDRDGKTALMLASFEGHTATAQVLLSNGVQVNAKDADGTTALMLAASKGHTEIVQALLAKGADVNVTNQAGQTALMFAVIGGHAKAAQVLVAKGADTEMKNRAGQSAVTLAEARGLTYALQTAAPAGGQAPAEVASLVYEAEKRAREAEQKAREVEKRVRMTDTPPPRITLANAAGTRGLVVPEAQMRVSGSITDGVSPLKLFVNGQPAKLDSQGRFNHPVRLTPGENVITLNAIDAQGRNVESSLSVRHTGGQSETVVAQNKGPVNFGRYHALVIGNNAYASLPKLLTAVNDAEVVASTLQTLYGFEVTLLRDVTREQIINTLDKLRTALTEQDNLLIYYAGHGTLDKEAERGYWLPVNAQPDTKANWLSTTEITDTLKAMSARHVLLVADSCYSGTLLRDGGEGIRSGTDTDTYFARLAQKRSRTALTSGGLEPVLDSGGGNHSVFTKVFLSALRENTGILDGNTLSNQIKRMVVVNAAQTPEYSDIRHAGHDGGDFVFVRKK